VGEATAQHCLEARRVSSTFLAVTGLADHIPSSTSLSLLPTHFCPPCLLFIINFLRILLLSTGVETDEEDMTTAEAIGLPTEHDLLPGDRLPGETTMTVETTDSTIDRETADETSTGVEITPDRLDETMDMTSEEDDRPRRDEEVGETTEPIVPGMELGMPIGCEARALREVPQTTERTRRRGTLGTTRRLLCPRSHYSRSVK